MDVTYVLIVAKNMMQFYKHVIVKLIKTGNRLVILVSQLWQQQNLIKSILYLVILNGLQSPRKMFFKDHLSLFLQEYFSTFSFKMHISVMLIRLQSLVRFW
jgi:hypothetical protein